MSMLRGRLAGMDPAQAEAIMRQLQGALQENAGDVSAQSFQADTPAILKQAEPYQAPGWIQALEQGLGSVVDPMVGAGLEAIGKPQQALAQEIVGRDSFGDVLRERADNWALNLPGGQVPVSPGVMHGAALAADLLTDPIDAITSGAGPLMKGIGAGLGIFGGMKKLRGGINAADAATDSLRAGDYAADAMSDMRLMRNERLRDPETIAAIKKWDAERGVNPLEMTREQQMNEWRMINENPEILAKYMQKVANDASDVAKSDAVIPQKSITYDTSGFDFDSPIEDVGSQGASREALQEAIQKNRPEPPPLEVDPEVLDVLAEDPEFFDKAMAELPSGKVAPDELDNMGLDLNLSSDSGTKKLKDALGENSGRNVPDADFRFPDNTSGMDELLEKEAALERAYVSGGVDPKTRLTREELMDWIADVAEGYNDNIVGEEAKRIAMKALMRNPIKD